MKKNNIAIVVAEFHKVIADTMVEEAEKTVRDIGALVHAVVRVLGCFEMPLAVKRLIQKKGVDAVVVLGFIEKGETLHGEVMGYVVYHTLMQLQLAAGKPVGFGIIGPGATVKQARTRMKPAAQGAVRAAVLQVRQK
ncbi:6,7-dimethyl-8-ribityllumazine synthase [Candidatus Uhrbacteria bacterium]|nr:6,7-dimethyl-8-ribityllumazine synthase [Candidatus Uhrbacteria bacterium]